MDSPSPCKNYGFYDETKTFEDLATGIPAIATDRLKNRLIINVVNGVLRSDTPKGFADAPGKIGERRHHCQSVPIKEPHWGKT